MEKENKLVIGAPCEIYDVALVKEDDGSFWWHQARIIGFDSELDALVMNECFSLEKAASVNFVGTVLLRCMIVDGVVQYSESSPSMSYKDITENIWAAKESLHCSIREAATRELDFRQKLGGKA